MWLLQKKRGGQQMKWSTTGIIAAGAAVAALAAGSISPAANAAGDRPLFIAAGGSARPPIGWIEFCSEYAPECETTPVQPRDVTLTTKAWKELASINKRVNETVHP